MSEIHKSKLKTHKDNPPTQILLALMANKWTVPTVRLLRNDTLRFYEIQKALPDTTQKVLTETLRKLERNGLLKRTLYPTVPPQVEYNLTPLGIEFLTLSESVTSWGEKHTDEIKHAQRAYDSQSSQ